MRSAPATTIRSEIPLWTGLPEVSSSSIADPLPYFPPNDLI